MKWYGLVMNIEPAKLYAKNAFEEPRLPESLKDRSQINIPDLKMPKAEIAK